MPPPTEEDLAVRRQAVVEGLGRRTEVVDRLAAGASSPLDWLGLRRQASTFLRQAEATPLARQPEAVQAAYAELKAAMRAAADRAAEVLGGVDPAVVAQARTGLGMRLALIGKGGAGKTVLSSTLARTLARRGRKVFAADLDTNPGLAYSLGLPPTDAGLPAEALEQSPGGLYGWQLSGDLTADQAVERFAAVGPDGVRFLGLGKIGSVDKDRARQSVAAVLQILVGFTASDHDVIADLEAGPTTPFEGYHAFSEDVVVVVGPAWRSAMTARRLLPMVGDRRLTVVANRFRDEPDHPGLAPAIRIPFDPDLAQAEREGLSPIDACPDSPAVEAIGRLADLLVGYPRGG